MEVLQKLTLYDLLGYALPGAVLLLVYGKDHLDAVSDEGAKGGILLLLFGFLIGIAISEIMQWMEWGLRKVRGKKQWLKLCEKYSLTAERMGQALKNAQMIKASDKDTEDISLEDCREYQAAVYADIQTDPKYSRIHNYASAALLYKNMVFVTAFGVWRVWGNWEPKEVAFLLIVSLCFFARWVRFREKKVGYAMCWFVDKYRNETETE